MLGMKTSSAYGPVQCALTRRYSWLGRVGGRFDTLVMNVEAREQPQRAELSFHIFPE